MQLVAARSFCRRSSQGSTSATPATRPSPYLPLASRFVAQQRVHEVPEGHCAAGVATAGGEAATDQEMAHLLLAEEGLEPLKSQPSGRSPRRFFFRWAGPPAPRTMALKPYRAPTWNFLAPSRASAGNVRAGTEPGPRFGHRVPKSGPTGWAIPPGGWVGTAPTAPTGCRLRRFRRCFFFACLTGWSFGKTTENGL